MHVHLLSQPERGGQLMATLLRSQIECPECGDIIASLHQHNFQTCECGKTSIDGGREYLRLAGDAICAAAASKNGLKTWDRSISMSGEHNPASAAAGLEVYKALWAASESGNAPISVAEVHRSAVERSIRLNRANKLTVRAIRAYLSALSEGENAPVEREGSRWRPKIPLVERPDAP
jgi:hypothetical protein